MRTRPVFAFGLLVLLLSAAVPLAAPPPDPPPSTDTRIEVYGLRHYVHPNFTRIVVDVGGLREFTYGELHGPDRIFINIYQAKLNPILHGENIVPSCAYLSQVRIAQRDSYTVRLVADMSFDRIKSYRVYYLPDPFRIVLDIYPQGAADIPPAAVKPGSAEAKPGPAEAKPGPTEAKPGTADTPRPPDPTAAGYSLARQLALDVKTVVIDPGHGGTDPGCLGLAGQKEKDIVLDIALKLKDLLAGAGLDVILTRETDIFIPVENRCVPANQKLADLFISIHANASLKRQRAGIETFYLNFSPDAAVNETAARENATSTKRLGEMMAIVKKIAQNSKILESRDLAEKVQRSMIRHMSKYYGGVKDLGAKGGPFWVLIGSDMPSILVEVSHLSNSAEEARLKDETYRRRMAEAIARGVLDYRESLGKGKSAS